MFFNPHAGPPRALAAKITCRFCLLCWLARPWTRGRFCSDPENGGTARRVGVFVRFYGGVSTLRKQGDLGLAPGNTQWRFRGAPLTRSFISGGREQYPPRNRGRTKGFSGGGEPFSRPMALRRRPGAHQTPKAGGGPGILPFAGLEVSHLGAVEGLERYLSFRAHAAAPRTGAVVQRHPPRETKKKFGRLFFFIFCRNARARRNKPRYSFGFCAVGHTSTAFVRGRF